MKIHIPKPTLQPSNIRASTAQVNNAVEAAQNWETWHQRFGHIGYSGLKCMMQANIVEGFTVDDRTLKPDCKACMESKQFVKPFPNKTQHRAKKPEELTHIDLWGKSLNSSIHGN